ncbi:hypothetical protein EHV15_34210 [Paenibacillus oralis]|uniref:Uncharacterized protein n=1 Tax=Paenibacillus oralis TaxID=2490856 RepID=A0A3P3TDY2_9BACL|nr:hypothetical protein [Paenibacillus oralis]RRJ54653.1 hypothetical protein EHV15_34210 [Paenibacillus oralis]
MASIRGISVDQYIESVTDSGMYYMGYIMLDGHKVGIFENEGEDGCTEFDFYSMEAETEFNERVNQYFKDHPATLEDNVGFILELLDLMEAEREFFKKAHQLNGPFILIQANTYSRTSILDDITEVSSSYHILRDEEAELEQLQNQLKSIEYNIFRNAADFMK